MSSPRVSLDEFIRQLRAAGPVLIERWIAAALADPESMPPDFEVGECIHLVFPLDVAPLGAPSPNRIACDECRASLEFEADVEPEAVAHALVRRGWIATPDTLLCPRCRASAGARN
jgi:hypothetical protein